MIRINLLPHREIKRRERRTQFYVISGMMVLAGLAVGLIVHMIYAGYIEVQERKNDYFKAEIKKLDAEIAEIRRLRQQIDALLARKQVIESLQSNRAETVHLFNELVQRMPEGVYLSSVKQTGSRIALAGYAQSNSRVSVLMRNLEDSPFLAQPRLIEVKAATVRGRRVAQFSLNINIERRTAEQADGKVEPAKVAVKKGAKKR